MQEWIECFQLSHTSPRCQRRGFSVSPLVTDARCIAAVWTVLAVPHCPMHSGRATENGLWRLYGETNDFQSPPLPALRSQPVNFSPHFVSSGGTGILLPTSVSFQTHSNHYRCNRPLFFYRRNCPEAFTFLPPKQWFVQHVLFWFFSLLLFDLSSLLKFYFNSFQRIQTYTYSRNQTFSTFLIQ